MPIQAIVKGVGGTVDTYFLTGPPSSCTVTLYSDAGSAKVSAAAATVDSVSTTTVATVAAKASSVVLTSAAGVVEGRRYLLGAIASTEPSEVVTVRSLSASTASLVAPTMFAHTAATQFRGIRVSYAVSSTQADALWWGGHADFIPAAGDPISEVVDCVKHKIPDALCDESDLREVFPKLAKMVDAELDISRSLRVARDEFLVDFGGKFRVHSALGAGEYRRACAMRWWLNRRYGLGADWKEDMDVLYEDYKTRIAHLQSQVPFDTDGDERTDGVDDHGFTTVALERA